MMNFYDMLNHLEELNGSNDKEYYLIQILRRVKNAEAYFRFAFNDQVFGVKEATCRNAFGNPDTTNYEHISDWLVNTPIRHLELDETYYKVPDLIKFGQVMLQSSGQELESELNTFLTFCEPLKRKWFCRAILKDLRCGVQVKTVNKAFKACGMSTIAKFAMQLCDKLDLYDENMVNKKIEFPCSMECKYDGIRIQAEVWVDRAIPPHPTDVMQDSSYMMGASMTSRRGKDRTELYPEIIEELKTRFAGQHVILDCEVISRSFQELTRKDSTATKKLVIWDLLMDEKLPYKDRWSNLISLCENVGITTLERDITEAKDKQINYIISKSLFTAEHYNANSLKEAQDYYSYLNEQGEEGIILKIDSAPYERGSRKYMFKCKKVFTADLKCVGFKYGEGKRSGKVGALELIDASGKITVDVGSGLTDDMVDKLTSEVNHCSDGHRKEQFVGQIVEIKYNEITETNSIRNPRFVCFRDDKDEADDLSEAEVRQA